MDILTCTLCKPPVTFRTHGELAAHLLVVHGKVLKRAIGGADPREEEPEAPEVKTEEIIEALEELDELLEELGGDK